MAGDWEEGEAGVEKNWEEEEVMHEMGRKVRRMVMPCPAC